MGNKARIWLPPAEDGRKRPEGEKKNPMAKNAIFIWYDKHAEAAESYGDSALNWQIRNPKGQLSALSP